MKPSPDPSTPEARVLHHQRSTDHAAQLTVCVTLFEYRGYVLDCLESVREQTLGSVSLVVVDDASGDGGEEAVRAWMQEHAARFRETLLLQHPRNLGLAATRNTSLARATSEFVFVLDADNLLYPRCLESLLGALAASERAFAYPIIEQFGDARGLQGCDGWNPGRLAQGNYVDAMALLRRRAWELVGGYRSMRVSGWEDYDFWCRCVEAGLSGVLVPEILGRYRIHRRSLLRRSTDTLHNHLRVCDEIRRAHPWVEL